MKQYTLYWIKETFSTHYYHKSDILNRFIQQYEDEPEHCVIKQFQYITRVIPFHGLLHYLKKQLNNTIEVDGSGGNTIFIKIQGEELKIDWCESKLLITSPNDHISIVCFNILRNFDSSIFIVENDQNQRNYGWVGPLKKLNRSII